MASIRRLGVIVAAIAALGGVAALGVFARPLLPVDETRYLAVAWEMWRTGDWMTPHLNGEIYSHKPPLLFWLINLAWAAWGDVSGAAARAIAPAFGLGSLLLAWRLSLALWPQDRESAAMAPWVLATTGVFMVFASMTMFDAMLTAATLLALLALTRARRSDGRGPWLAFGAALALGVLCKGPVILVHALPVALAMPLWADRATRPALGRWYRGVGLGVLTGVALTALWLVPAIVHGGPEYREQALWGQSAGRMVESFAHRQPFWFFLALIPVFLWPWGWSPMLRAFSPRALTSDEGTRFCAVQIVAALALFSMISGKQTHYLLPEVAVAAVLIAQRIADTEAATAWRVLALAPVALIALGACVIASGLLPAERLNTLFVSLPTALAALAVAGATIYASLAIPRPALALGLIAPGALAVALIVGGPVMRARYDAEPLAQALAPLSANGLAVVGGRYHGEFTFAARLTAPVDELLSPEAVPAWVAAHPDGALLARTDHDALTWAPAFETDFRGRSYGVFRAIDAGAADRTQPAAGATAPSDAAR